tara:strand:- start:7437 stop:7862 length:426 start_codon:yes stop_codon:yes gene_type:complete
MFIFFSVSIIKNHHHVRTSQNISPNISNPPNISPPPIHQWGAKIGQSPKQTIVQRPDQSRLVGIERNPHRQFLTCHQEVFGRFSSAISFHQCGVAIWGSKRLLYQKQGKVQVEPGSKERSKEEKEKEEKEEEEGTTKKVFG